MKKIISEILHYIVALSIAVFVYGSIPFVSLPTLGQALWLSGFAKSFDNANGLLAIKAINFGIPGNAPIAFGLTGAFLESIFIKILHIHPVDAYSLMSVCMLALSLFGTIKLCQLFGQSFKESAYISLVYLTLPLIWQHAGYSMISFGFAMLPMYVYMSIKIIYFPKADIEQNNYSSTIIQILSFLGLSLFSVFNDGYTYVMFFFSTMVIWSIAFIRKDVSRKKLIFYSLLVITISAILSYLAYINYLGKTTFNPENLDFFRGFGLDLTMLFIPSAKVHWLWDAFGLSIMRSSHDYFGDASVWTTTFALPIIVFGIIGFIFSRKKRFALPLLIVALSGLYFSLGPSMKINSLRPYELITVNNGSGQFEDKAIETPLVLGATMPEELTVFPTGSAFFYKYVPGFKNMRATYRWSALLFLGLFGLTIHLYQELKEKNKNYLSVILILFLIINNLPDLPNRVEKTIQYRNEVMQIDSDLVDSFRETLGEEKIVFFAPPGNDFLINYISSMGNYYTYNIGGDKNLQIARNNWPREVFQFPLYRQDACFDYKVSAILGSGKADYVVLPYFDTLLSSNEWPPSKEKLSQKQAQYFDTLKVFKSDPNYVVINNDYYAAISLSEIALENQTILRPGLKTGQPVSFSKFDCEYQSIFEDGWYRNEGSHIWSSDVAELVFNVADECQQQSCDFRFTFRVYDANVDEPKNVVIEENGETIANFVVDSDQVITKMIPLIDLDETNGEVNLQFYVPDAVSPYAVGASADGRTLGIDLFEFEVTKPTNLLLDHHYTITSLNEEMNSFFSKGWYENEGSHIWSSNEAEITFAVPEKCQNKTGCDLSLWFNVYNAESKQGKIINFEVNGNPEYSLLADSGEIYKKTILLDHMDISHGRVNIKISIPEAVSPYELGESIDGRVLGINLLEFELKENGN